MPGTTRTRIRTFVVALVALAVVAAAATSAVASTATPPGPTGSPVTMTVGYTLSSFDVATSSSGTAYVGWIANTSKPDAATRAVHLCTIKPGTTSCSGGVQVVDSLGDSSAEGLRVLVHKSGVVALMWFYEDVTGGHIGFTTATPDGKLAPAIDVGSAPDNGQLLDAEIAPDDSVWSVAGPSSGNGIQVRPGGGTAAVNVRTPYPVGYAELAFTGNTPVIAIQKGGAITHSAGYTYESHGSWSAVHNVAHTWTSARVGLADTRSGLRLIAGTDNASYQPVVARWTGSGFSNPTLTGDHNNCGPSSHDTVADASGRLADVAYECEEIAVANLPQTGHAAIVRFSARGTINATDPRMATTPRGHAFVVWSVESGTSDRLLLAEVLLPDLSTHMTKVSSAGSVTVTGPVSCLPADDTTVAVSGKAATGWHVAGKSLTLGSRTLHSTLNGASLTAGTTYALIGHVTFAKGTTSRTATATLTFRSCPAP
jgi:hypothetical protein